MSIAIDAPADSSPAPAQDLSSRMESYANELAVSESEDVANPTSEVDQVTSDEPSEPSPVEPLPFKGPPKTPEEKAEVNRRFEDQSRLRYAAEVKVYEKDVELQKAHKAVKLYEERLAILEAKVQMDPRDKELLEYKQALEVEAFLKTLPTDSSKHIEQIRQQEAYEATVNGYLDEAYSLGKKYGVPAVAILDAQQYSKEPPEQLAKRIAMLTNPQAYEAKAQAPQTVSRSGRPAGNQHVRSGEEVTTDRIYGYLKAKGLVS